MQILYQKRPDEMIPSRQGNDNIPNPAKKQKNMVWLFPPASERGGENELRLNGYGDEVKFQIGSYYYWIRRIHQISELCRLAVRRDSLVLYEVLQHDTLGITDDDLEDAIRLDDGELMVTREYRISHHIRRKLQILYAP